MRLGERLIAQACPILDLKLEPAQGAEARNRRRREHAHEPVGDLAELAHQLAGDSVGRKFGCCPLVEVIEHDEHQRGVGQIGPAVGREPGEGDHALDARLGHGRVRHPFDDGLRPIERCARRKLGHAHQEILVLHRQEAGRNLMEAQPGQAEEAQIEDADDAAGANDAAHRPDVAFGRLVEEAVEAREEAAKQAIDQAGQSVALRITMVRTKQDSGESRRKRQRVDRRENRRNGDGQGELTIELALQPGQEGGRNEDRRQHGGDGQDRPRHLVHGRARRLLGRLAQGDVPFDILDDNDGVIDDDADRQHQTEQGQGVQREAEQMHHGQRAHQGDGYGDQGNDGRPPALQEEHHHKDHQQGRLEQGHGDRVQRSPHEDGGVIGDLVFQPFREIGLKTLHGRPHGFRAVERIGSRALQDLHGHGRLAVEQAAHGVGVRPHLDPRHVAQLDGLTVCAGLDDNVAELFHRGQSSQGVDGNLIGRAGIGLLADRTGGHLDVLFADRGDDIAGGEPHGRDLGRV
ncbi:hypothetical protein D3C85_722410 [compost metagenome]